MIDDKKIESLMILIKLANLEPETRMECEGILMLGDEVLVEQMKKNLVQLIDKKESAYQEYKQRIKEKLEEQS